MCADEKGIIPDRTKASSKDTSFIGSIQPSNLLKVSIVWFIGLVHLSHLWKRGIWVCFLVISWETDALPVPTMHLPHSNAVFFQELDPDEKLWLAPSTIYKAADVRVAYNNKSRSFRAPILNAALPSPFAQDIKILFQFQRNLRMDLLRPFDEPDLRIIMPHPVSFPCCVATSLEANRGISMRGLKQAGAEREE